MTDAGTLQKLGSLHIPSLPLYFLSARKCIVSHHFRHSRPLDAPFGEKMPLLVDDLSVWDISFRLADQDPRKFRFRIPLEVEDHFRNLMLAILKGELACQTITLEKRDFESDEKEFSAYRWLDDIYACIHGRYYNRKLLRWAKVGRFDLMLWCERMKVSLPEFWFPPGWNLEYELPEGHVHPGYYFHRRDWTSEDWDEWQQEQDAMEAKKTNGSSQPPLNESGLDQPSAPPLPPASASPMENAVNKMRPNQEARIACQHIAKMIWQNEPDRTIASVVIDELIQKYGGGSLYVDETVREWVKVIAPQHVRNRRGAPRKNRGEDK